MVIANRSHGSYELDPRSDQPPDSTATPDDPEDSGTSSHDQSGVIGAFARTERQTCRYQLKGDREATFHGNLATAPNHRNPEGSRGLFMTPDLSGGKQGRIPLAVRHSRRGDGTPLPRRYSPTVRRRSRRRTATGQPERRSTARGRGTGVKRHSKTRNEKVRARVRLARTGISDTRPAKVAALTTRLPLMRRRSLEF